MVLPDVNSSTFTEQGGVTVRSSAAAPALSCAKQLRGRRNTEQDALRRRPSASRTMARSSYLAGRSSIASRPRAWNAIPAPAAGPPDTSSTPTRCAACAPAKQDSYVCTGHSLEQRVRAWADRGKRCADPARPRQGCEQRGTHPVLCRSSTYSRPPEWSSDSQGVRQVYKGYYQRGNCFVAVKKINCFEKVRSLPLCAHPRSTALLPTQHQQTHAKIRLV